MNERDKTPLTDSNIPRKRREKFKNYKKKERKKKNSST
jgi:hypothetical protein